MLGRRIVETEEHSTFRIWGMNNRRRTGSEVINGSLQEARTRNEVDALRPNNRRRTGSEVINGSLQEARKDREGC